MDDEPHDDHPLDPQLATNRANWDARVPVHLGPEGYDVGQYIDDPERLSDVVAFDQATLGDLTGKRVAHLQCHIGTDTVSLARLGAAEAVGIDFSEAAIAAARDLAEQTGAAARFVLSDVYNAAATIDDEFDVVYVSVGTITWLDDIDAWAANVAGLLRDGGRFVFRDLHPAMWPWEEVNGEIVPHYPYWTAKDQPLVLDEADSYSGSGELQHTRTYEWSHTVAEVLNALIGAGLRLDRIDEHDGVDYPIFPSAVKEGQQWFLPEPLRGKMPLNWTITATKVATPSRP